MMHIVHSVFSETAYQNQAIALADAQQADAELAIRFIAYQEICSKYQDEITAIRKYMPGWKPRFSCELVNE
jgi:hypothetical protein